MAGEILAVCRSFPAIREHRRRCTLLHWKDHSIHPAAPSVRFPTIESTSVKKGPAGTTRTGSSP